MSTDRAQRDAQDAWDDGAWDAAHPDTLTTQSAGTTHTHSLPIGTYAIRPVCPACDPAAHRSYAAAMPRHTPVPVANVSYTGAPLYPDRGGWVCQRCGRDVTSPAYPPVRHVRGA